MVFLAHFVFFFLFKPDPVQGRAEAYTNCCCANSSIFPRQFSANERY